MCCLCHQTNSDKINACIAQVKVSRCDNIYYVSQNIIEVTSKRTVRITVSCFKTYCQNHGNVSTSVKHLSRKLKNRIWRLVVTLTIAVSRCHNAYLSMKKGKSVVLMTAFILQFTLKK